jgi:hypothetical protein
VAAANETAEKKKQRALQGYCAGPNDNAASIIVLLESTNNKALKAVGTFGENLRRDRHRRGGSQARSCALLQKEPRPSLRSRTAISVARRCTVLRLLQFGAAAALGARESLGVVVERDPAVRRRWWWWQFHLHSQTQPAGGTTVINLITSDPYGREAIIA